MARRVLGAAVAVAVMLVGLLGGGSPGSAGEADGAVVGGERVEPGSVPYQVAIVLDPDIWGGDPLTNQICGGSLIAEDVVLTAAHCAKPMLDAARRHARRPRRGDRRRR